MALIPIDQYKKGSATVKKSSRLKFLPPKAVQPVQRPDVRQSENYKKSVTNADRMAQDAQKASSFRGMAKNALRSVPQAVADTFIGTPVKLAVSAGEVAEMGGKMLGGERPQYSDRTYSGKVLGKQIISPFKSFQSDYGKTADDVIAGKKGMGSAVWDLAKVPLAGLETGVGASGIARGLKALAGGQIKNAGAIVSDAFLPTNFSKGLKPLPSRGTARSTSPNSRLAPVDQIQPQGGKIQGKLPQTSQQISEDTRVLPLEMPSERVSSYTRGIKPLPEKVNPLAEGKYKTVHAGGKEVIVDGKPVDIHKDLQTILHKDENGNWVVTEVTSGRSLTGGGLPTSKHAIDYAKSAIDSHGIDNVKRRISEVSGKSNPLLQEAGKYKSAEEFVKAQTTVYRSGRQYHPDRINPSEGVSFTYDPEVTKRFDGPMQSFHIKPEAKILDMKDIPKEMWNSEYDMVAYAKKNGYDAIKIDKLGQYTEAELRVVNPEVVVDRYQLTDLYNKAQGGGIPEVPKVPVPIDRVEIAQNLPTEAPTGSKLYPNIFRSGESSLENQGQAGKALKGLMKEEQVAGDLQAGKWKALVKKQTSQLNDAQRNNLTDVLEGTAKPIDKAVADSSVVLRNLLNKVQKTAKDTGLDVGYREDYFPRQYNWDEITKGKRKEEVLQHMVDSGQASTKAEAESFLKDFIGKNRERKAGNLEYERLFDIPGYERDPEKALTMYADSAARRISEATYFGNKDQVSSALINKIAEGGGDYREAQKIFDNIYKGEDKNAFAQFLLGYNAFTKLSLGFFSNLTQSVNTSAKAGLLNTLKGAGQALAQGVKATKGKNYDDLAVLANTLDDHVVLQESGLSNKFIKGAMYFFQKVEHFNRRTATYAGANRATELAEILKKDPKSAFAIRQLESLGIKADDIVKGKLTQEQLLKAANKMTRITQFKIDSLNLPTAWRTPLGKVLSQFKSFSFMQTKFIRDEIVKEARMGNFAPLARFIVLAPMASYLTQSARNAVNNNEKSEPSFRKFDLYRKAVGDLPSDFVTQMQYANEKKDKWYTTPIRNVKNFSSPLIGPSGGDILELASSLEQKGKLQDQNEMWYSEHPEAQKDPNLDLKRFGVSKIPYVGRALTNTFLGYGDTTAQEAKKKAIDAIQRQDWKALSEAQEQDPYLRRDRVFSNLLKEAGVDKKDPADKALYEELQKRKSQPFYTP